MRRSRSRFSMGESLNQALGSVLIIQRAASHLCIGLDILATSRLRELRDLRVEGSKRHVLYSRLGNCAVMECQLLWFAQVFQVVRVSRRHRGRDGKENRGGYHLLIAGARQAACLKRPLSPSLPFDFGKSDTNIHSGNLGTM